MKLRTIGVAMLILAALIISMVAVAGCDQVGTPAQIHPTHGGPNGECIEFDDEPCDDDPFDTDDLFDKPKTSKAPAVKSSPRPVTTRAPAPVVVRTRRR